FNVVAADEGTPHAVLVRAVEPVAGADLMSTRRGLPTDARALTNGPGKLCRALAIGADQRGVDLTSGSLYLADGVAGPIGRARRVNIDYAGAWADKPWRFYEKSSRYVSVAPR
ncbi:MAG TPA: DNA-3-methyladenine glycosylase, partial [Byssovorax sp.]